MKKVYSAVASGVIILVLYTLIALVIPFPLSPVFWLAYVFGVIAILAQAAFIYVAFHDGSSARSRFYGFPILRIGLVYGGVQLVLSFLFMLLGSWIPMWIPALLFVILLGCASLGLIASDNVRDSVKEIERNQMETTYNMHALRRTADMLAKQYPELTSLAESIHFSDPVSNPITEPLERELHGILTQFADCPDQESRLELKKQAMIVLDKRNAACLSSKTV